MLTTTALKKICEVALNLKIICFFHENPSTVDTSRGLAAWLNHNHEEIKVALAYLVRQNILVSHRTKSTVAYAYTQDKQVVKKIDKFLERR